MQTKCPYCGYIEEVIDEYWGQRMACCACGREYDVAIVHLKRSDFDFHSGNATVKCPLCGEGNVLPFTATNRNVQCGVCGGKFHTEMRRQVNEKEVVEEVSEKNSAQSDYKPLKMSQLENRELPIGGITIIFGCIIIGVLSFFCFLHLSTRDLRSHSADHEYAYSFPVYDSKRLTEGELFRIDGRDFEIISVIDGGLFGQDGVLFRYIYESDYKFTVYYVGGIDISNLSDGDQMPSIDVRRKGTYTYTSASGSRCTVKAFIYVP